MHKKTQGYYLVLGEAKLESNLQPVTVYLGVDGQLWVRDKDEFDDGRFSPLDAKAIGLTFGLDLLRFLQL